MTKAEQELVEHCLANAWCRTDGTVMRSLEDQQGTLKFLDEMELLKLAVFAERAPEEAVRIVKEGRLARSAAAKQWRELSAKMERELGREVYGAVLAMAIEGE